MTRFLIEIRRGISSFLSWWGGELAALVPSGMRRWFHADTGQIVFDVSGDEITIDQVSQRSHREIGARRTLPRTSPAPTSRSMEFQLFARAIPVQTGYVVMQPSTIGSAL